MKSLTDYIQYIYKRLFGKTKQTLPLLPNFFFQFLVLFYFLKGRMRQQKNLNFGLNVGET